ncbi:MAG: arsenate reductase ArsC [Alphaproteobacteria bacterium]|nr:arsenate reductase ArsC [Alphaproteobacteria bacterium]
MSELPAAVLFCCNWNSIRSPMAEAILKHLHNRKVFVDSVGVRKGEIDPFAVAAMDEIGIDLGKHRCKTFADLEDSSFDVIVSLSPEAQHRAVDMVRVMSCEVEFWNVFDPTAIEGGREARLDAYRQVRDDLIKRIKARFPVSGAPKV